MQSEENTNRASTNTFPIPPVQESCPKLLVEHTSRKWLQMNEPRKHIDSELNQASFYDEIAELYDDMEGGTAESGNVLVRQLFLRRKTKTILEMLRVSEHNTVVDVGCGTGLLARAAAQTGARVIAVDISKGMLKVASEKITYTEVGPNFIIGSALNIPVADSSIDKYISSNLIEHLSSIDDHFREVHRILVRGGLALFNFPNGSTRLASLEQVAERFLDKCASYRKKTAISGGSRCAENHSDISSKLESYMALPKASSQVEFIHSNLDPHNIEKLLLKHNFELVKTRTFGVLPYLTPDWLTHTHIPRLFEEICERIWPSSMDFGSAIVIVRKIA